MFKSGKKVLYAEVLHALYGMLVAALLWYKRFCGDLESDAFQFNPYDPCVANRDVGGHQHTIQFHVDDLMSSHVAPQVNDELALWLNPMYGKHTLVKCMRGLVHDYLCMTLDFSEQGGQDRYGRLY